MQCRVYISGQSRLRRFNLSKSSHHAWESSDFALFVFIYLIDYYHFLFVLFTRTDGFVIDAQTNALHANEKCISWLILLTFNFDFVFFFTLIEGVSVVLVLWRWLLPESPWRLDYTIFLGDCRLPPARKISVRIDGCSIPNWSTRHRYEYYFVFECKAKTQWLNYLTRIYQ